MSEEIEFTVTKPLTELQLTKDNSIQAIPLSNETYIYMALYRQTKDPTYSLLNSHYDNLLGFMEELEDE